MNCELVAGGDAPPVLRPTKGKKARLVVTFAYQHLAEEAVYEGRKPGEAPVLIPDDANGGRPTVDTTPSAPNAKVTPLVDVRPARSSRLVFALPEAETIEFSSAGILEALSRLELLVHPLAAPGDRPTTGSLGDAPLIFLPGGLVAHLGAEGPLITRAARGMTAPDPSTAGGLSLQARELRRARAALETQTGISIARAASAEAEGVVHELAIGDATLGARPIFGAGGLVREPGLGPRRRPALSRRPTDSETSIEAPYRLVISPSGEGALVACDRAGASRGRASPRRALAQPARHSDDELRRGAGGR